MERYHHIFGNFYYFHYKMRYSTTCKKATQSIKKLYQNNNYKESNQIIVERAFIIYNGIDPKEPKNHFVINTMIKLCLSTKHQNKIWSIWNDINPLLGTSTLSYPSLLRCCIESNQFEKGSFIHNKIPVQLIENDDFIQNALINFYGHFNQIQEAMNIFNSIPPQNVNNVNTISALMKAYNHNQCELESLSLYTQKYQAVKMNDICHLFAIKACLKTNNYQFGQQIIKELNTKNISIELLNFVIHFYGHFGKIEESLDVFNRAENKSIATINSMLRAYIHNNLYNEALSIYNDIQYEHLRDDISHLLALKSCTNTQRRNMGQTIIDCTLSKTKNRNYMNTAIYFYSHFGDISNAENVFRTIIKKKCIQSINALMTTFYDNRMFKESVDLFEEYILTKKLKPDNMTNIMALKSYGHLNDVQNATFLFQRIESKSIEIINSMLHVFIHNDFFQDALSLYDEYQTMHDDVSHILLLKACIAAKDIIDSQKIIKNIDKKKKRTNSIELNNTLISFFGHSGDIEQAIKIFDDININKDNVSINNMMHAFIQNMQYEQALEVYDKFEHLTDDISVLLAIKSCTNSDDFCKGNNIIDKRIHSRNISDHKELENTLIYFYGHFGEIHKALNIFNGMTSKSIQTVNSMMTTYCDNQQNVESLELYNNLHRFNVTPTTITHLIAIKVYGNCGDVSNALKVFNFIKDKSVECINCMIRAYLNNGYNEDALSLFDMFQSQISHNDVSNVLALKACTNTANSVKGMDIIHKNIGNIYNKSMAMELKCTLIDFYGNSGNITEAIQIFDSIEESKKDIICINVMMTALFENGYNVECIELFKKYKQNKIKSDIVSHVVLFKACTQSSSYHYGRKIHQELNENMLKDRSIQINLIHLYGKCGMLDLCQSIFDDSYCDDINLWNAMIHAFGRNGDLNKVQTLYNMMRDEVGIEPDDKIYTSLINACSHSGDIERARILWQNQIKHQKKNYTKNTINALVDCFARNGCLEEAYHVILDYKNNGQQMLPYSVWMSLLNGCRKYRNKEIAENVFNEMKQYKYNKDKLGAASILLSHIYSAYNEFDRVQAIRNEMRLNGWTKMKGISEIDINGTLYRFEAGNKYKRDFRDKKEYQLIDDKLHKLSVQLKQNGFEHDFSFITKPLDNDSEKEYELLRHSEKLALVYGLLKTPKEYQIVINKNLRICNDCHEAIKLISNIEDRKIIISDSNRVHTFQHGQCSCNDRY